MAISEATLKGPRRARASCKDWRMLGESIPPWGKILPKESREASSETRAKIAFLSSSRYGASLTANLYLTVAQ